MGDALKDIYSVELLKDFDSKQFIACVLAHPWDELQLKARIHRIAEKLGEYLPKPFEDALQILFSINESCVGFPHLFFPDFVATYGQQKKTLNFE